MPVSVRWHWHSDWQFAMAMPMPMSDHEASRGMPMPMAMPWPWACPCPWPWSWAWAWAWAWPMPYAMAMPITGHAHDIVIAIAFLAIALTCIARAEAEPELVKVQNVCRIVAVAGFDFKTKFHKNPQLATTYGQKAPITQYVRRIDAQIAVRFCAICSIYIMPKAIGDISTVSILIGGCVFYSPSLPCVCRRSRSWRRLTLI